MTMGESLMLSLIQLLAGFLLVAVLYLVGLWLHTVIKARGKGSVPVVGGANDLDKFPGVSITPREDMAARITPGGPRSLLTPARVVGAIGLFCAVLLTGATVITVPTVRARYGEGVSQFYFRVAGQIVAAEQAFALADSFQNEIAVRDFRVESLRRDLLVQPFRFLGSSWFRLRYVGSEPRAGMEFRVPFGGQSRWFSPPDENGAMGRADVAIQGHPGISCPLTRKTLRWGHEDVELLSLVIPDTLYPGDGVLVHVMDGGERRTGGAPYAITGIRPATFEAGVDTVSLRLYFAASLKGYWVPEYRDMRFDLESGRAEGYEVRHSVVPLEEVQVARAGEFFDGLTSLQCYELSLDLRRNTVPVAVVYWQELPRDTRSPEENPPS